MAPASLNLLTMNASFFTGMPTSSKRDTDQVNTEIHSEIEAPARLLTERKRPSGSRHAH